MRLRARDDEQPNLTQRILANCLDIQRVVYVPCSLKA